MNKIYAYAGPQYLFFTYFTTTECMVASLEATIAWPHNAKSYEKTNWLQNILLFRRNNNQKNEFLSAQNSKINTQKNTYFWVSIYPDFLLKIGNKTNL